MPPIRIIIADDHPVFRYGLKALIATDPEMEVVGEAETGQEAVKLAAELAPDVVLMDINMPGLNGIEATRQIAATNPGAGVLIVSMLDDDTVFAAMRAGARGYLVKGAEGDTTLQAIHIVAGGGTIFSPGIAERVIDYFSREQPAPNPFPELTGRERQILSLIAQGLTNAAIAERLTLSPKTVRNHVSEIYGKLQVASRGEAIAKARDAGLGKPSPPKTRLNDDD